MTKHLHPQPRLLLLFALFLGMGTAWAYDFYSNCPTGQRLYYTITDATNRYVSVVAPGGNDFSGWNNFSKPTGALEIPETIERNGITYFVYSIGDYAFYFCSGLTSVPSPTP